jgi:hypothetical protein
VTLLRHAHRAARLVCALPKPVSVPRLAGPVEGSTTLGGLVPAVRRSLIPATRRLRADLAAVALATVTPAANDDGHLAEVAEEASLGLGRLGGRLTHHQPTLSQTGPPSDARSRVRMMMLTVSWDLRA